MVNDQLLRIHQLRLLSYEKMSAKTDTDDEQKHASLPNSHSPDPKHKLSSSAPESKFNDQDEDDVGVETARVDSRRNNFIALTSKSQDSSPTRGPQINLKQKQATPISSSKTNHSTKRRSSWRNLLSPSYKSRSDEFHKLFCDKIPKNERLIADYACALQRDILLQGRVYISINYIAFYSNIFSWITKLVVRLRDITEIYKANTARIIPNAIQVLTKTGEKHVFASFLARDKSYATISRIWQNNLLKERMSDQEIRNLVHFSYGKDLGMDDNEELKINSVDPTTPANVPADDGGANDENKRPLGDSINRVDDNNNKKRKYQGSLSGSSSEAAANDDGTSSIKEHSIRHSRYNSMDYQRSSEDRMVMDSVNVISELANKLGHLSDRSGPARGGDETTNSACCANQENEVELDHCRQQYSPAASSTVVVDTPKSNVSSLASSRPADALNVTQHCVLGDDDCIGALASANNGHPQVSVQRERLATESATNRNGSHGANVHGIALSPEFSPANKSEVSVTGAAASQEAARDLAGETRRPNDSMTNCECEKHLGQLIADQEFDIDVDTLFSLIFTNSKFMRAHMIRRGMVDANISSWKRSSPSAGSGCSSAGDRSNSSTLSRDEKPPAANDAEPDPRPSGQRKPAAPFRPKQVRQLNYSMNINHMWAKQVQIEEKQNICCVRPGVYVLESQSNNSGIPYGDTFSIELTYCLTGGIGSNRSRMLVHGSIRFHKDKQNWKLSMIKPLIEKQSIQGIEDFISDLTNSIRDHIGAQSGPPADTGPAEVRRQQPLAGSATESPGAVPAAARGKLAPSSAPSGAASGRSSTLARAKSKLKERKLRSMYRYYIHDEQFRNNNNNNGSNNNSACKPLPAARLAESCGAQDADGLQRGGNQFRAGEHGANVCDSSDLSSSLEEEAVGYDDNGSMMMMSATHETDSQLDAASRRGWPPGREEWASSSCCGDSQQDSQDPEEGRRGAHLGGSASCRCAVCAPTGGPRRRRNRSRSTRDSGEIHWPARLAVGGRPGHDSERSGALSSAHSNSTLSNGKLVRTRQQRRGRACAAAGRGSSGWSCACRPARAHREPVADSGRRLTGRRVGGGRAGPRPAGGTRAWWWRRALAAALGKLGGLQCASTGIWAALLLVLVLHVLVLRRLDGIEARLQLQAGGRVACGAR